MAQGTATRSNPSVEPRVYPAGRAVLLLAVCAPEVAGRRLTVDGRRVQAVRFGRLALLLSFADQQAYGVEEIARKRDDAAWLAAEARLLERAVERVRALGAVLPMRLLTVFAYSEALEETAREQYTRWCRALTRLGKKRECLVHLYAGPHVPPGGMPYLMRATARATRSARPPTLKAAPPIADHAQRLWRECVSLALSVRRVHVGECRGVLWAAVLLLSEAEVAGLEAVLERSAAAGTSLGITAYLEAPRAPFTFV